MRVIDPGTKRWLYGITFRPGRGWVVEDGDFFRVPGHAIATHGRTGFRHFALGSVAEAVIRHAKIPVLCFPWTGKE